MFSVTGIEIVVCGVRGILVDVKAIVLSIWNSCLFQTFIFLYMVVNELRAHFTDPYLHKIVMVDTKPSSVQIGCLQQRYHTVVKGFGCIAHRKTSPFL